MNAVWKWIAVSAISVLFGFVGGITPSYLTLAMNQRVALTRTDVDHEATAQMAPLSQQVSDLKDQVSDLKAQLNVMTGQINEVLVLEKKKQ